MTDTPWTPGPWVVSDAAGQMVLDQGGLPILVAHSDADARLIAAAPEMAELLASLLEAFEKSAPVDYPPVADARDLLARIRGES